MHTKLEQVLRGCRLVEAIVQSHANRRGGTSVDFLPLEFEEQNPLEDLKELAEFVNAMTDGGIQAVPSGHLH